MYLGNNLGLSQRERLARRWRSLRIGPWLQREKAMREHRLVHKTPVHKEAVIFRGRIKTPKPKITPKIDSGVIVERWVRPGPVRLGQWETVAATAVTQLLPQIFGGGTKEAKKAASIARRQGDAMKAATVIQPLSNLINQSTWDNIQRAFLTAARTGQSFGIAANAICQGGYDFATKARDLINATPPSMVVRKSGGYPSWTDLQQKVTDCVKRLTPTAPTYVPTGIRQPISPTFRPLPSPYGQAYGQGVRPQYPYTPTQTTPQITFLPTTTPSTIYEPEAPIQAGIDPTWLMMGGLGLFALIMMQK